MLQIVAHSCTGLKPVLLIFTAWCGIGGPARCPTWCPWWRSSSTSSRWWPPSAPTFLIEKHFPKKFHLLTESHIFHVFCKTESLTLKVQIWQLLSFLVTLTPFWSWHLKIGKNYEWHTFDVGRYKLVVPYLDVSKTT